MNDRIATVMRCIVIASMVTACNRETEPAPPPVIEQPSPVAFDTTTVTFTVDNRSVPLHVEIAHREEQRAVGLMDRDSLPQESGMIFLYNDIQGAGTSFWMYRTRIPLDIAYFDGTGRIVSIRQMEPCPSADPSRCPTYPAGAAYYGAVEANRGWFARHGIGVGDYIVLPGRTGS